MTISISSPVTGAPVSGLTTPTYSFTADQAPNSWSKSWYVSGIGGTQTGVDTASTASKPWTVSFSRPSVLKTLNAVDATGVVRQVGFNTYTYLMRRGFLPLAGQAVRTAQWRSELPILVGSDLADAPNIRAAFSSYFGVGYATASGFADSAITGSL
jgi:hypothetical protein